MSRVGKKEIVVPKNVKISESQGVIKVEGPKGKLEFKIPGTFKLEITAEKIVVKNPVISKDSMSLHGLIRTSINNMIKGVAEGFQKDLEVQGVGFKAQLQGKTLQLSLGFSTPINYQIPEGITVEVPKPVQITIKGIDKAKVGETAAKIRSFFEPEPYKGKGVRYVGEYVRHKAGKTVA